MTPYIKYKFDDIELLKTVRDEFWARKKEDKIKRNTGKIHDEQYIGYPGQGYWWEEHPGFAERVAAMTYPYGEPIQNCWVKFYNTGEYSCLHTDDIAFIGGAEDYSLGWTNSILLEQTDDIDGGDLVFAGDGWEPNFKQIKSRLITDRHKEFGDAFTWDSEIVHGVSKINRGHRMTLIVVKKKES